MPVKAPEVVTSRELAVPKVVEVVAAPVPVAPTKKRKNLPAGAAEADSGARSLRAEIRLSSLSS